MEFIQYGTGCALGCSEVTKTTVPCLINLNHSKTKYIGENLEIIVGCYDRLSVQLLLKQQAYLAPAVGNGDFILKVTKNMMQV